MDLYPTQFNDIGSTTFSPLTPSKEARHGLVSQNVTAHDLTDIVKNMNGHPVEDPALHNVPQNSSIDIRAKQNVLNRGPVTKLPQLKWTPALGRPTNPTTSTRLGIIDF
jgi:hypothetical protein